MRIKIFGVGILYAFFGMSAFAQGYPFLHFVGIQAQTSYNNSEKMYYYSYALQNDKNNIGRIWMFEVDISRNKNSVDFDSTGLKFESTFEEGAFRRHFPALVGRIVPVGFVNPPGRWNGGLSNSLVANWGGYPLINPGETSGEIRMMSRGLPGIRRCVVIPHFDVDKLFPSIEDTSENAVTKTEMDSIREAVNFRGWTIGPTAPPAVFDAVAFLNTLISYKDQAFDLGWIDNQGIANSLDAKLDNVKKQLEKGKTTPAINNLQAFLNEVEAQKGKHLSSEAYALLKFNAEYLLEKLSED